MNRVTTFIKVLLVLLLIGLMIGAAGGCAGDDVKPAPVKDDADQQLIVAVSIVPQKAFLEAIAGDLVDIVLMVPPGNSPGNYEPTPGEMEMFSQASAYFAIGVPTETANILPRAAEIATLEVVPLHEKVAARYPDREIAPDRRDPHIWLSPQRAMVMVEIMAEKLGELDEINREVYEANVASYIAELEELHLYMEETFASLENRKFIVFHPAFGYLADDYGLEMYALEEDGKEATPTRLAEMVDLALAEEIRVIFYQAEIDSPQSRSFAEEIGGETIQLAPLSPDYINNLQRMAETMSEVLQ